ncbi:septal ring lytic transglycosylase RlpA family protein [Muricoccus radiodurans]|uniref:septal ring lytic transglycosylase RlpA family protein n=1 Tax=Muricoccus radiodurans TaxID=2231721 RepID=UPI003CF1783B
MRALAAGLLLLAGCAAAPPAPAPQGRYLVGEPYALGGRWSYPREDTTLVETGLASVLPDGPAGRATANGERFDPAALMAAHRTLQLPAVVRVTNLENGRSLAVRVNDRGPTEAGRVIGLSRRAATLLGVAVDRPARVRVAVDGALSRAVAGALPRPQDGPRVETAPVGTVDRESLAPPEGARQAMRVREGRGPVVPVAAEESTSLPDVELPGAVTQGAPEAGALYVEGSRFTSQELAGRQAARMGGARVQPVGTGRRTEWLVRLGPLNSAAEADRALEAALRAGVSEARVVVD